MTEEQSPPPAAPSGGLAELVKRLAKVTGLSDELAQAVLETAVETIKTKNPDKAEQIETALADEKTAQRVGDLVEKLARKVPKPEE
ncbi:MAG TPA: hypothetical protein PKH77_10890 [Anaerolineae bacterium]|nr:hypothetical protein [Anaerolineae bacterium]